MHGDIRSGRSSERNMFKAVVQKGNNKGNVWRAKDGKMVLL